MSKLVAIVGPTASGKSELGMQIARQFRGEIICADSRTIYKGMNIGTAKPSKADQSEISHHLLDLIEPGQNYSAAEFKAAALQAISEIDSRGHLPIIVGGSGLYAYAVLYDYQFPAGPPNQLRDQLQQLPGDQLVEKLKAVDPEAVEMIDLKNPRRVIRAIETAGLPKTHSQLMPAALLVGLRPNIETLRQRITQRVDAMVEAGFIDEVKVVIKRHGWENEATTSIGYRAFRDYIEGSLSLNDAKDAFARGDLALAKRQLTWFKRNPDINWFEDVPTAERFIVSQLQKV